MKIVIVGDGKVGYNIAKQLLAEGHDIVVIDNNPDVLEDSLQKLDVLVVDGNGVTLKTQEEADVANSDLLIAATSADEINLLCCILAKKLGCRHAICRMSNPDYVQSIQYMRDDFGLSMTVNPELTAAREIFRILQFPSFLKRDTFAKGRVEIVELKLKEDCALVGKKLEKLSDVLRGVKVLVCAVDRGGEVCIPDGSFEKKLYSMYLSYLPKEKVAFPLKMNADARGSFTELLKTEKCGQVSVNISKPGITKGQHWHNSKWEFFIVVSGHGLIQERRIGSDEVLEFEVSGDKIEAVHMLPGYTHNIINLSDTEDLVTVMWANEQFDPIRPDTFGEKV